MQDRHVLRELDHNWLIVRVKNRRNQVKVGKDSAQEIKRKLFKRHLTLISRTLVSEICARIYCICALYSELVENLGYIMSVSCTKLNVRAGLK